MVLAQLGESHDLPHAGAVAMPGSSQWAFSLQGVPLVAKVCAPDAEPVRLATEVSFAAALAHRHAPFPAPAAAYGSQPLGSPGAYVTLWRRVVERNTPVDYAAFGQALQRLQDVGEEIVATLPLPRLNAIGIAPQVLNSSEAAAAVGEAGVNVLRGWFGKLIAEANAHPSVLGHGVLHGDVRVDNILSGERGPVLVDSDTLCVGPREWDLVGLAVAYVSGSMRPSDYVDFRDSYRSDVTQWSGFEYLARIRAMSRTGLLMRWAGRTAEGVGELHAMLDWWAGGAHIQSYPHV